MAVSLAHAVHAGDSRDRGADSGYPHRPQIGGEISRTFVQHAGHTGPAIGASRIRPHTTHGADSTAARIASASDLSIVYAPAAAGSIAERRSGAAGFGQKAREIEM